MFDNEGYTTPEGHWLPKQLLLPDARSFTDVLTYVGEWDTAWTMDVDAMRRKPPSVLIEDNELGPYCQTRGFPWRHRSLAVTPTEAVVAAVRERIVTRDDHMHFELVLHEDRDRVLVILSHGQIIGDHWLAYIDPATIPDVPEADEDEPDDDPVATYLDRVDGHWYVCRYDRTLPQIHAKNCATCEAERTATSPGDAT